MEALQQVMEAMDAMKPVLKMLAGMSIIMGISGLAGYCMGREGERRRWIERRAREERSRYRVSARIKEDKRGKFHVALGKLERDPQGGAYPLNVDWVTSIGDTFDSPAEAEKRIKSYWPDAFILDESEIKRNIERAERLATEITEHRR